jgi:hypothetical protein
MVEIGRELLSTVLESSLPASKADGYMAKPRPALVAALIAANLT